jgi:hypothetical protein
MRENLVRTKHLTLAFKRQRAARTQLGSALVRFTIRPDRWLVPAFHDTVVGSAIGAGRSRGA